MSKAIAVDGCTLQYSLDTGMGTVSVSSATITPPTGKVKCKGKVAFHNKLTVIISQSSVVLTASPAGAVSPTSAAQPAPATINISGTSSKAKTMGDSFVLEGDEGSVSISYLFPGPNGTQVSSSVTVHAKVSDAGQSVVKVT